MGRLPRGRRPKEPPGGGVARGPAEAGIKGRPLKMSVAPPAMNAKLGITVKERQRRMQNCLCLKCGKAGHRIAECRFNADA